MKSRSVRHRFFAAELDAETVCLSPAEAHHAADVLRLSPGDQVELFDGAGTVARGTLERLDRKHALVRVRQRRTMPSRPEPVVELAFAVPKGKRLDWLLEKATELGVARLAPLVLQRSVAAPAATQHARDRWRGVCIAAAKQSGANFLPEIAGPSSLPEFLAAAIGEVRLVGDADRGAALPAALGAWSPGKAITILIGPEGGLTEAERAAAKAAGFAPARLGETVLRVETAAVSVLAVVNAFCQS
jgi:16S rRNA (uracil1498-N3)-methyltransferase